MRYDVSAKWIQYDMKCKKMYGTVNEITINILSVWHETRTITVRTRWEPDLKAILIQCMTFEHTDNP